METKSRKAEVQEADDRRVKSLLERDYHTLAQLLSECLVYHHSSGKVDTKDSYLSQFLSGKVWFMSSERLESSIDVIGDTAICRGIGKNEVSIDGSPVSVSSRYFGVWALQADGWRLIAWSSVKV